MTFRSPDPESGAATKLRHPSMDEREDLVHRAGLEPAWPFDR